MNTVDHPDHYGGADNPYEVIKIIEALDLDFHTGNALKYLLRWRKKNGAEDLRKAIWYIKRLIEINGGPQCQRSLQSDL